ncbi:MAG: DUF58 domain-containing protein [Deltaproteobacteria bacterium]|nr:DUF58 domain-containing protein [Deltaproteobacteria bacterium]
MGRADLPKLLRRANLIITTRGLLLALFAVYLFSGPAILEADIIATILSLGLLALLVTLMLITAVGGVLLKKSFGVTLIPPQDQAPVPALESGKNLSFLLRCNTLQLLPLYQLSLKLEFERGTIITATHTLKGSSYGHRFIREQLKFPHRGIWHIRGLTAKLHDQFGLTSFDWKLTAELSGQSLRVKPPSRSEGRLPILSSCRRSGDTLIDIQNRQGDYFDLKQYHPSDGLKKIVWKIFAKSGKLIARHPEPSMTPEGQVIAYCLAGPQEDFVCAAALGYLRRLEELELEIFFGCEAMRQMEPAQDSQIAEDLLIETVWQSACSSAASLPTQMRQFIGVLQSKLRDTSPERVIIFCSTTRLGDEEMLNAYVACGHALEESGINPVFFLIAPDPTPTAASSPTPARVPKFWQDIGNLIIEPPSGTALQPQHHPALTAACMRNHWQVLD